MDSGRRPGKSPVERSNFAQACTLLSQFLNERRNLSHGNAEAKAKARSLSGASPATAKSSGFVRDVVDLESEESMKADRRKSTSCSVVPVPRMKPRSSQMTIFFGGQVLVFNGLNGDRASKVIALARKGSSNINGSISVPEPVAIEHIDLSKSASVSPEPPSSVQPEVTKKAEIDINVSVNIEENGDNNKQQESDRPLTERQPSEPPANGSDLPIARRNSLHRFLEKRKDRVASKAPYQVPNRAPGPAPATVTTDEGRSREGQCSDQLQLRL